ncbi:MAG: NAD(P)H-quinone oxidoreductase, partial [Myxococcales bacterium]|nr:NAD(P)H-quinone oxidoreductase [Myxococcales bacterium]
AMVHNGLRVRVAAAGLNRADLLQRRGFYPPPPGASPLLGLECAGEVVEVDAAAAASPAQWKVGDRAMALLPGGGYAEEVVVDAGSAMRVPDALSDVEAGVFPEVYLTVFSNVFQIGRLERGGALLVHGGGSGIGTASIQLAREAGARVFATAGSAEKCARCRELGADLAIDYTAQDFAEEVAAATGGAGVDVVLDSIGAAYLAGNLRSLAVGGRLVLIGLMQGAKAEIDLGALLVRRLSVIGSTLRTRSLAEKAAVVAGLRERFGEAIDAGRLRPVVHATFPMERAEEAHALMQSSAHFGKIALEIGAA